MKTHLLSTLSGNLNANIIATVVGGLIVTLVSFICKLAYDKFRGRNSQDIPQPKTPDAVAAESKNTNTRYKGKKHLSKKRLNLLINIFTVLFICFFAASTLFALFSNKLFNNDKYSLTAIISFTLALCTLVSGTACFFILRKAEKLNDIEIEKWDIRHIFLSLSKTRLIRVLTILRGVALIGSSVFLSLCYFYPSTIAFLIVGQILLCCSIIPSLIETFAVFEFKRKSKNLFSDNFNTYRALLTFAMVEIIWSCNNILSPELAVKIISIVVTAFICIFSIIETGYPYSRALRSLIYNNISYEENVCKRSFSPGAYMIITACYDNQSEIELPDTFRNLNPLIVDSIGDDAFYRCYNLQKIKIPSYLTVIGRGAFADCINLSDIIYNDAVEKWQKIEKREFWDDNTGNYTVHCTDGDIAKDGTVTMK